jgi:hypothetical protein
MECAEDKESHELLSTTKEFPQGRKLKDTASADRRRGGGTYSLKNAGGFTAEDTERAEKTTLEEIMGR